MQELLSVHFIPDTDGIFIVLVVGLIAGLFAQILVGSRLNIYLTIAVGIVGGWLGYALFQHLLDFTKDAFVNDIIRATVGALLITVLVNVFFGSKEQSRDRINWEA
jgi:uncharacterized membrane protein YeaQ/YmgE (transglycosylase-associated protein family)